ncbi:MAG: hypothetical protein OSJ73_06260 [Lachnospiraceae bacterium]|jgi:predicted DNA-binding transcriptional regulator AlpA|nr:hypothetical protein [Lachnospiraceae bacterium]
MRIMKRYSDVYARRCKGNMPQKWRIGGAASREDKSSLLDWILCYIAESIDK